MHPLQLIAALLEGDLRPVLSGLIVMKCFMAIHVHTCRPEQGIA